ncbi:lipid A deacylase LpxR family protein [Xanthovirga aplysinae]|uniref:lipid A deacylase LpxR family protein n=1 Tax=Xanthovirga aplysinae TaxID=2529853 RepID=UPI0012BC822C|nr:lipid A deacylase LpxR family protein [Xanthovirga aplysinae]MTI32164.1 lipid A deacylase LpxR family protein [Xanthovirga aplysinae]
MRYRFLSILLLSFFSLNFQGFAQSTLDSIPPKRQPIFFGGSFSNDILQLYGKSDGYFTNGVTARITGSFLRKLPSKHLLFGLKNSTSRLYTLELGQEIYTPLSIDSDGLLENDRPYAGWFYATHSLESFDELNRQKLTTSFQLGVTGKWAFAGTVQTKFHELINNSLPQGWDNQIGNSVGLNYYLKYEKGLLNSNYIDFTPNVEAGLGSVYVYGATGFTLRLGLLDNFFSNDGKFYQRRGSNGKFKMYLTFSPTVGTMFRNSLLQGMPYGGNSPHLIPGSQINTFYFEGVSKLTLQYDRLRVSFNQNWKSPEFKGAESQRWGAVEVGIRLF